MGQGHSVQDVGVQRSKSRHSTRSLPENSRLHRRSCPTKNSSSSIAKPENSSSSHGVYEGESGRHFLDLNDSKTASELWWKDAAPYYSAPAAKYRPGPRSLDMTASRPWDNGLSCPKAFSEYAEGRSADAWSDVASDMYRIREKSKSSRRSKRHKHPSDNYSAADYAHERKQASKARSDRAQTQIPEMPDCENMETQSEVILETRQGSKPRRSRSSYNAKEASQKKEAIRGSRSGYSECYDEVECSSRSGKGEQSSPARPSRLSVLDKRDPPPRPPKSTPVSPTTVPGEQWVDFPPNVVRERDLKVTFDETRLQSPKREVPVTPPKSPGSTECDKLIIQSMRTELTEERTLRVEAETKAAESEKKITQLEQRVTELNDQLANVTEQAADIEAAKLLEKRLAESDEKMSQLSMEKEQYQLAYGRCLDDIAKSVARALMQQKSLKSECLRLQKRVLEVEWENKLLRAQLQLVGLNSPGDGTAQPHSGQSNNETPLRLRKHAPGGYASKREKYRQSMGSDPTLQLSGIPENMMCLSESLASITSQNFTMNNQHDSSSPLTNGGEGLCSRPQSFSFDLSATSLHQQSIAQEAVIRAQQNGAHFQRMSLRGVELRGSLPRQPPPQRMVPPRFRPAGPAPRPPLPPQSFLSAGPSPVQRVAAKVSPLDRLKDLEKEDMFGGEEEEQPRNFGQVENGTQGFTDFYSNDKSGKGQPDVQRESVAKTTASSNRVEKMNISSGSSVVEKMRGGNSGSSLSSMAFLGSLLNGEDNKNSTPKSSPQKGNLSNVSDEGSTTPTLSETAFSSTAGELNVEEAREGTTTPTSEHSHSPAKEVIVGYMNRLVQPEAPKVFLDTRRTQKSTAVVNPTRYGMVDGYSTMTEAQSVDNKLSVAVSLKEQCGKPQDLWSRTDKATSTESLEWDQMIIETILTSSTCSSATRSTSSGFGSDLQPRNSLQRQVSSGTIGEDEPWQKVPLPLRRWLSDSELCVRGKSRWRLEKINRIIMASRAETCWPMAQLADETPLNRSVSTADLTDLERRMIHGQQENLDVAMVEEDQISVGGVSREGLFDLTETTDLDVAEIDRAFQSIEALTSDVEKEPCRQFNSSFYALFSHSGEAEAVKSDGKLMVKVDSGGMESPDGSEDTSNDDSLSPQGRMFLEDFVASTSSSYTSEDSEDDGVVTVQAWLKQLKTKPKRDKSAVPCVRYSPRATRKSIMRAQVFSRFGQQERDALSTFSFLKDHPTDISSSSPSPETDKDKRKKKKKDEAILRMRKTELSKDLIATKRLSRSADGLMNEATKIGMSSSASLHSDDSLLLSDLCAADLSLSSSSSLSFQCP